MLLGFQLDFSDDVVRIIQTAINSDGGHPENRKANSMVKSFFIRVRANRLHCIMLCILIEEHALLACRLLYSN